MPLTEEGRAKIAAAQLARWGSRADRLLDKISPEPNSGCWLWTGYIDARGYGKLGIHSAHRVAYQLLVGPIPSDRPHLDHLCRVHSCVNPQHLEPVTPGENTRRGLTGASARARMLAKTTCPQGHPYADDNLYVWHGPRGKQRKCRTCGNAQRKANHAARRRG